MGQVPSFQPQGLHGPQSWGRPGRVSSPEGHKGHKGKEQPCSACRKPWLPADMASESPAVPEGKSSHWPGEGRVPPVPALGWSWQCHHCLIDTG